METSTLRPGLLVSMKTKVVGNVSYRKKDIERPHAIETGAQRAKWETVRTIADPAEHERAIKTRSKIRAIVTGVCARSDFGLLCPQSKEAELEKAFAEARKVASEFNETSNISKVEFFVMTGRVAQDDVNAIKAIRSEVSDLIGEMTEGLKKLDVKAVREAANRARGVATMLSDEAANKVSDAIAKARAAARKLVKAGDLAAVELDHAVLQSLAEARTAFLDVDASKPAEIAAPEIAAERALEFDGFNAAEIDAAEEKSELDKALDMPKVELEIE